MIRLALFLVACGTFTGLHVGDVWSAETYSAAMLTLCFNVTLLALGWLTRKD